MDFDDLQERMPENDRMGDDPMVFGEGGSTSMDSADDGFDFGDEKPAPEYDLSDEPDSGSSSGDFGFDEPAAQEEQAGGLDFDEQSGAGLDAGPISPGGGGSTSFFGFFGKGMMMAILKGDAAEEVASDPKAFLPALFIYMFPAFIVGLLYALFMNVFFGMAFEQAKQTGQIANEMQAFLPVIQKFSLSFVVVFPLFVLVLSLISVGILHLLAKLFGGQGGFLDYYQTIGVGSLISWGGIIPYIGFLFSLWMIPVSVVITSRVHNLSTGRAVAVVLIPITIVVILIIALFSAIMMAVMGAAGAGGMHGM